MTINQPRPTWDRLSQLCIKSYVVFACLFFALFFCVNDVRGADRRRPSTGPELYAIVLFSYDASRPEVTFAGQHVTAHLYTNRGRDDIQKLEWQSFAVQASRMVVPLAIPQWQYDDHYAMWLLLEADDGTTVTLTEHSLMQWVTPLPREQWPAPEEEASR